jgi:hypothetical protein
MNRLRPALTAALTLALAPMVYAQIQGPSTASTPYLLPVLPGMETIAVITTDNTGPIADDSVPRVGGGGYGLVGIPDGMGAFDNGDGSFTLLVNHELGNTQGVTRAHGGIGSLVSRWVIYKNSLTVASGEDLMKQVYGWNATTQQSNTTPGTFSFHRYCSADLPEVTAFYNAATNLGTQSRIFMHGEEGSSTGWARGSVASGPDTGKSYILGKFNLATNGTPGGSAVGAWENLLASPFAQDKTIVIGTSDGGTGIMGNALSVYVGTKTGNGSEVDRAGLTNGTLKFVRVGSIANEISNGTTRTTGITNGMAFSLSLTTSTVFSRPEDGAWNPLNPKQFYFVTTDQLDQVGDGLGAAIGRTRLWRLTFTDITNPDLGGTIDLLIDGRTVNGQKVNMFDNMTVNPTTGHLLLQEDVGGAAHNGKIWEFDPSTFSGTTNTGILTIVAKHDPARFGDRANGVTTTATPPYNNDEESSGIIDITAIMSGSTLHKGNLGEAWYISSDQAHYGTNITTAQVEGGQIVVLHQLGVQVTRTGIIRDRRTGTYAQQLNVTNSTISPVQGPVGVWLDNLSPNATLTNASGSAGNYMILPGTDSGLAAGASATVTLQFANPTNTGITYTTRVQPGSNPVVLTEVSDTDVQ